MAMSVTYTNFNGQLVHENRQGTERFYAPDTLGSTAALLDPTGTVTDTFTYWPYGEIWTHTGSSATPFTVVGTLGYYLDVPGVLLYVRARHLRQALARWQTVGLLWPVEGPYEYAFSSPLIYTDPSGELAGGIPIGAFPEGCRACSQAIKDNWFPSNQHLCNSCYAHCTACCVLTALSGAPCANSMQHLEDELRPEHTTKYRDAWCAWGVQIASGLSGAGGAEQSCSSKCLAKCPYEKPNPRPSCNKYMRPGRPGRGPNGHPIGNPSFPPEFTALSQCDPGVWQQCKNGR